MTDRSSGIPGRDQKDPQTPRDHNDASTEEIVSTLNKGGGSGTGAPGTKPGEQSGSTGGGKWAGGAGDGPADGEAGGEAESSEAAETGDGRTTKIHHKLTRGSGSNGRGGPLSEGREEQERAPWRGASPGNAPAGSMTAAEDDDDEDIEEESIFEALRRQWYLVVAALAVFVVGIVFIGSPFSGSGSTDEGAVGGAEDGSEDATGAGAAQAEGLEPIPAEEARDTGLVFEERTGEDGEEEEVTLLAGDMAWRGEIETVDEGEILTFEGPTAAQFRRGFELPQGSVHTGVFAVAEPDEPVLHATYHRIDAAGEERTTGDYFVTADGTGDGGEGGAVLAEGSYVDERTGDGDEVVRTYTERSPQTGEAHRYAVSFQAPEGTPIPYLAGWNPSGEAAQGEASQ